MDVLHNSRYEIGPIPNPALWIPPIGIPNPSFGLFESHMMYVGVNYSYSTGSAPYKSAGHGPYSHYVDSSDPNSTNTNNNYGTLVLPRKNMPMAAFVSPGAVIEVKSCAITPSQISMIYIGTLAAPIFVRGSSLLAKGLFTGVGFLIRGQYIIYENLEFISKGPDIRSINESVNNIVIRSCNIHAGANLAVGGGVNENFIVSFILIYNNQIHTDNFDPNGGEFPENDVAGVSIGHFSENVWVVDNDIKGASGDAIGAGHAANYTAKRWFIGRNLMHDTGENGIDLKEVDSVVVSQNKIYNFTGLSSGDDGCAVVVHYGPNVSAKNIWFLYNEIYNATEKGIQIGGTELFETYFIGNIIHDIHNSLLNGRAFVTFTSCKINMVGNIFYNNDNGVDASGTVGCGKLIFKNNIISVIQNPSGYYIDIIEDSNYKATAEITNNIFYPIGPLIDGTLTNCIMQDPLFVDAANKNFNLQSNSPAIDTADSSIMEELADKFFMLFGVNIHKDFANLLRPINGNWDIGPYEFR